MRARWLALLAVVWIACSPTRPLPALRPGDDDPEEAAAYDAMKRRGSDDPIRDLAVARETMRRMPHYSTVADRLVEPGGRLSKTNESLTSLPPWTSLGPGNIGGRTRALVIDPDRPELMFAGGVSGGVWKSEDAGGRWIAVGDELTNLAVNSLAMDPIDHNVLYAGTGEGYFREEQRGTGLPIRGAGIFVTRNGGASWKQAPSTATSDFYFVNDIVISSHDRSRIYAATRSGVWRSTDGAASWTRVLATDVKGGCLDLAWRGDTQDDYLFASCGTFEQATVWRAQHADTSAQWEAVLSEPNEGRTSLAIAPSNHAVIYALAATNEPGVRYQGLLGVYRSTSNGDPGSWEARVTNQSNDLLSTLLLTNVYTATTEHCIDPRITNSPLTMGWYCNTIAVDPVDPNRVWVGGVDLFRSDDGGRSFGLGSYWWLDAPDAPPQFAHADQHAIVFDPGYDGTSNRTAYFANDGGLFRTDNARAQTAVGSNAPCFSFLSSLEFERLNHSYGVTQFYHGAVFPDGRTFIGGTQDNGTVIGSLDESAGGGPDQWLRILGGDGGYVAIDPTDPRTVYAEAQNGNIFRSFNGGRTFTSASNGLNDQFLFVTPYVMDPNAPRRLWMGGTRMWRTDNRAASWSAASAPFPAPTSAIAIAPGNSSRVLAGTNGGHILRSENATLATQSTVWTQTRPRDGFVSSLTFDPIDPNVAYATYSGFGGGAHVWTSTDGGASWSPIDGSDDGALPDIPAHSLAVDPTRRERLYLGTDLGVFVSIDGGLHWAVENSGFAPVITEAVVIGQGNYGPAVYAFTHGRGAWRAELVTPGPKRRSARH